MKEYDRVLDPEKRLSILQQATKIAKGSEELIVNAKFLDLKEWSSTIKQFRKGKL
jgi:hypothetical protein